MCGLEWNGAYLTRPFLTSGAHVFMPAFKPEDDITGIRGSAALLHR